MLLLLPLSAVAGGLKDKAKDQFIEGLQATNEGEYVLAIGLFMASFDAYPHPTTAFNIARAYEDKGDPRRALVWFERFQDLAPHRAAEAADAVLRMREALDPITPADAPQPTRVAAAPPEDKPSMAEVLRALEADKQD